MRTRTSAHLPSSAAGGARTSRSALNLAPAPNADEDVRAPPRVRRRGCADLPVRIEPCTRPECGRGRPRTSQGSAASGARTSRSALNLAPDRMRTRTSAHLPGFGGVRCADLPVRIEPCTRPECGRGRPRTSQGSAAGGARTSRSALNLAPGRNADEDVRVPPKFGVSAVRGRPRPQFALAPDQSADVAVRVPAGYSSPAASSARRASSSRSRRLAPRRMLPIE